MVKIAAKGKAKVAQEPVSTGELPERRNAERHVTIYRTGRLSRRAGDELCIIRNISPGGAMVHVCEPYTIGEAVTLDLRANEQLPAKVAWVRDTVMGLKFDQKIDLNAILLPHSESGSRARAPRLTVPAAGRIQLGEDVFQIVTADVSQGGAKILVARKMKAGTTLRLSLDGLASRGCTVRWSNEGMAGVSFDKSLSVTELSLWAKQQRAAYLEMIAQAQSI